MTEEIRFIVKLNEGAKDVETLKTALPTRWKYLYTAANNDGGQVACVVALAEDDAAEKALRKELTDTLADRDLEWLTGS